MSRLTRPNVLEHRDDRMSWTKRPTASKHFEDRMLCRPRSPPGGAAEPAGAPGLPASYRGGPTTTEGSRQPLHATHPDLRNPICVFLFGGVCVWWCCGGVVSRCPRCLGRVAVGDLGVVPSGLSPRGAASFYTLGWGSGVSGVEWSAIYPGPCPTPVPDSQQCPACPHPAGLR